MSIKNYTYLLPIPVQNEMLSHNWQTEGKCESILEFLKREYVCFRRQLLFAVDKGSEKSFDSISEVWLYSIWPFALRVIWFETVDVFKRNFVIFVWGDKWRYEPIYSININEIGIELGQHRSSRHQKKTTGTDYLPIHLFIFYCFLLHDCFQSTSDNALKQ